MYITRFYTFFLFYHIKFVSFPPIICEFLHLFTKKYLFIILQSEKQNIYNTNTQKISKLPVPKFKRPATQDFEIEINQESKRLKIDWENLGAILNSVDKPNSNFEVQEIPEIPEIEIAKTIFPHVMTIFRYLICLTRFKLLHCCICVACR